MNRQSLFIAAIFILETLANGNISRAQNWPQWRGPNRDAKVTDFKVPAKWPGELTQKWKVTVGDGVATPALVDDKLYVFTRQDDNEIIRCLEAATGNELWKDQYASEPITGSAKGFQGPRSSPTVAEGKIVTLGTRGILSCYDAQGNKLWRKDKTSDESPRFFTSCSPIVQAGLCIAQVGGAKNGAIVAYDLTTGEEKWKWSGDGTAYSSPLALSIDGIPVIVAMTDKSIVAIGIDDQKILWQTPFAVLRSGYNAATPIVDSNLLIYSGSGRGTKAVKLEKQGAELAATELWSNPDISVQFNTPVLKDGFLYGLSSASTLFCINATDGKTAWTTPRVEGQTGYGSIVDAGNVLIALTPSPNLIVYESNNKEYKEIAKYKVGESDTYAYPILSGNRIFVKDKDSVILWTLE